MGGQTMGQPMGYQGYYSNRNNGRQTPQMGYGGFSGFGGYQPYTQGMQPMIGQLPSNMGYAGMGPIQVPGIPNMPYPPPPTTYTQPNTGQSRSSYGNMFNEPGPMNNQGLPAQPTGGMQQGQTSWGWSPQENGSQYTPTFGRQENLYINHMLGANPSIRGQIDNNNLMGSIAQLTGVQFNPNDPRWA